MNRFQACCNLTAAGVLAAVLTGMMGLAAAADNDVRAEDAARVKERVHQLVQDLYDDRNDVRDKAEKELSKLGKLAYAAVLKESKTTKEDEVRIRAERILKRISVLARDFTCLDLKAKANLTLDESFHGFEGNNLKTLPKGEQALGGAKFQIGKKMIQLASKQAPEFPGQSGGDFSRG